jgi:hypothetical protein
MDDTTALAFALQEELNNLQEARLDAALAAEAAQGREAF